MNSKSNVSKFHLLRKEYGTFEYKSYNIEISDESIDFDFHFAIDDKIHFHPSYSVPLREFYKLNALQYELLETLVFNIGMIELISYWKSTCSPNVVIRTGSLNKEQIKFWKKLYFNGLGEFFFLNGIKTNIDDFMEIVSEVSGTGVFRIQSDDKKVIVPVGGGKDSVVTLELLKNSDFKVIPMAVNPREAVERTITIAGFDNDNSIVVKRKLDKKLLEMNEQGFLNGHTPFSALLAFLTTFTAVLSGIKYIALSNESSANESTVKGSNINHQYSKSFEFERDFSNYISKYVTPDVHYFSFLRPVNELQIGYLFSKFPEHHFSFRSCNAGSKKDIWCGKCPKCLFTRIILGPFIDNVKMEKIFGKELLEDKDLKPYFDELTGKSEIKPFECVGTTGEVNAASSKIKNGWQGNLPLLLKDYQEPATWEQDFDGLLKQFNYEHNVPAMFLSILKKAI